MKKIFPALLFLALFFQPMKIKADISNDGYCNQESFCFDMSSSRASLSAKIATFFPLSQKVRHVYYWAMPEFTLEGNLKLCSGSYGSFYLWLDGSYIFSSGNSYGAGDNSSYLSLVPITLGAKYFYSFRSLFDVYLGAGAAYSFLNITDHSRYVHKKTSANNFGAIVKSGLIYHCTKSIYLDGFFNYSYQKFYCHKHEDNPYVERNNADLSGLQLGLGLGWVF